jgi:hypothetical protein
MENKIRKIMHDIYVEMYERATPPANFEQLVTNAEINENGEKVIIFNDYELEIEISEEIFKRRLKGLREYYKNIVRCSVLLGCSPRFKK